LPGHPSDRADEIQAHRVVVIQTELKGFLGVFAQFVLDRGLHRIAVLEGLHLDDPDLFHRGGDIVEPVKVRFGHARADDDKKGKARVFLCRDRRQGQSFKVIEPQVHALGLI